MRFFAVTDNNALKYCFWHWHFIFEDKIFLYNRNVGCITEFADCDLLIRVWMSRRCLQFLAFNEKLNYWFGVFLTTFLYTHRYRELTSLTLIKSLRTYFFTEIIHPDKKM